MLTKFSRGLQSKGISPIHDKNDKVIYDITHNYKWHTYRGEKIDAKLSFENVRNQLQFSTVKEHQLKLSIGR